MEFSKSRPTCNDHKKDEDGKGKLEFGTGMLAAVDSSLAVLLDASTSVQAMIAVIEQCFKE